MPLIDEVLKESEKNKNEKQKFQIETKDAIPDYNNIDAEKIMKRLDDHYDYIKMEKYYELFKTGIMKEPKSIHTIKREFYDTYGHMPSDELVTCYQYYNDLKKKAVREINDEKNKLPKEVFSKVLASRIGLHHSNKEEFQHPIQKVEKTKHNEGKNIMEHYKQIEQQMLKELIKDPQAIKYADRKTASMYEYVLRKDYRLVSEVNARDTKEVYKTMKMIEANINNYSSDELINTSHALGDLKNILNRQYENNKITPDKRIKEIMQRIEGIISDFVRQGRILDPE